MERRQDAADQERKKSNDSAEHILSPLASVSAPSRR